MSPITKPDGTEGVFEIELWGSIDSAKCGYSVTPRKVELRLVKKEPGKWPALVAPSPGSIPQSSNQSDSPASASAGQQKQTQPNIKAEYARTS